MKKQSARGLMFKFGAILILVIIAAVMFVIGRGHTVYIDNKTLDYEGESCKAFNRVNVYVDGERIAKLGARERGKATNIGQSFTMTIEVTREKGGEAETLENISFDLPYSWDGIVINVPGYLEGLPQDVWMTEYVAQAKESAEPEEEIVTDEFGLGDF
ncbi:MAG: hypothetical protein K6C08_13630 [Oscillospiraceae bacterium]|nr:hypothetical protein [Oscillospiraceae bacterium]